MALGRLTNAADGFNFSNLGLGFVLRHRNRETRTNAQHDGSGTKAHRQSFPVSH
jgi:hypothetical protein